jgi:hypothetical protein
MADPHEERANELEKEADFLEKGGDRVESIIKGAREDWESKKSSSQAPGAADADDAAPGGPGEDADEQSGGPA